MRLNSSWNYKRVKYSSTKVFKLRNDFKHRINDNIIPFSSIAVTILTMSVDPTQVTGLVGTHAALRFKVCKVLTQTICITFKYLKLNNVSFLRHAHLEGMDFKVETHFMRHQSTLWVKCLLAKVASK